MTATANCTDIGAFLRWLHPDPADVFEVRIFNCPERRRGTFTATTSGYFNDPAKAAADIAEWEKKAAPPGVYVTLNPCKPELLARSVNKLRFKTKEATNDDAIVRRRHLLIDLDPERASNVSSTDAEMDAALQLAELIRTELSSEGWPTALLGMSGNGAYLIYKLDLPNDGSDLVERTIKGLAERFSTPQVKVDKQTFNTSRIAKVFGTMVRKGDDLRAVDGFADRPHRMSWCEQPRNVDVVSRDLLESVATKPTKKPAGTNGHAGDGKPSSDIVERCWRYVEKIPDAISGSEGSKATIRAACECFRFGLSDDQALEVLRRFNGSKTGNEPWSEKDLQHKLDDGRKKVQADGEFGCRLSDSDRNGSSATRKTTDGVVTNFHIIGSSDDRKMIPVSLAQVINQVGTWPRRVGSALFVDDVEHGIGWLERQSALFGWLQSSRTVNWKTEGIGYVRQSEVFEELRRTSRQYESVEEFPHEPMIARHYYRCGSLPVGDGSSLQRLLDCFCPDTDIDRDLIQAAFMTAAWGGPMGSRPAIVVTSDDGRGAGKTTIAEMVGLTFGGELRISPKEKTETIKQRLLSGAARTRRVVLVDNVKSSKFGWADVEGMITATEIGGKQMYVGEATRPNTLTWFITLNGASLSTDMAQRSVIIKIRRPSRSANWLEDTRAMISANRLKIIGDVIAALRAEPHTLTQYSRWAAWERDVLQRLPEPGEAQSVILERQQVADAEGEEASILEEHFAEELAKLGYNTEQDQIHLPSAVAAEWFNAAHNDRQKTGAVSRILGQLVDERRVKKLIRNKCNSYGKGWIWVGNDINTQIQTDIKERIQVRKSPTR